MEHIWDLWQLHNPNQKKHVTLEAIKVYAEEVRFCGDISDPNAYKVGPKPIVMSKLR